MYKLINFTPWCEYGYFLELLIATGYELLLNYLPLLYYPPTLLPGQSQHPVAPISVKATKREANDTDWEGKTRLTAKLLIGPDKAHLHSLLVQSALLGWFRKLPAAKALRFKLN